MTNFFSWLADIISVIGAISAIDILPITLIAPIKKVAPKSNLSNLFYPFLHQRCIAYLYITISTPPDTKPVTAPNAMSMGKWYARYIRE